jgi:hypothetical protein
VRPPSAVALAKHARFGYTSSEQMGTEHCPMAGAVWVGGPVERRM